MSEDTRMVISTVFQVIGIFGVIMALIFAVVATIDHMVMGQEKLTAIMRKLDVKLEDKDDYDSDPTDNS